MPLLHSSQGKYAHNLAASRIENSSGDDFDLLSTGPTAQNVPAQAVIVDNVDPAIIYHNETYWSNFSYGRYDYGGSVSSTSTLGASLSFSFDGVAIWYDCVSHIIHRPSLTNPLHRYYGLVCAHCGSFKVSIDGLTPQRFNG